MKMFYAVIQIGQAHPENCSVTLLTGTTVNVDGERMVRCESGFLRPADDWHETQAAAYAQASSRLLVMASQLATRAEQLRFKSAALRECEVAS
jgi:hypothetical protein